MLGPLLGQHNGEEGQNDRRDGEPENIGRDPGLLDRLRAERKRQKGGEGKPEGEE